MYSFMAKNAQFDKRYKLVSNQSLLDILTTGKIAWYQNPYSDYPKKIDLIPSDLDHFRDQLLQVDSNGRGVIQIAVANKKVNPTVVKKLVELCGSAQITDPDNTGDNVFHLAAQFRKVDEDDAIFRLLKTQARQLASVLNQQNAKSQTPLMVAVLHDNLIAFRHYLSEGVANSPALINTAINEKSYHVFAEIIACLRVPPPPAYDADAPPPYSPIASSNVIELLSVEMQTILNEKPALKGFFGSLFASKPKYTREQKLDTVAKALCVALAEKDILYRELNYELNEADNAILSEGEFGRQYQAAVADELGQQQRPPATAPEAPGMGAK